MIKFEKIINWEENDISLCCNLILIHEKLVGRVFDIYMLKTPTKFETLWIL